MNYIYILFSLIFSFSLAAEKVLIFTYSYNRPEFIEYQYKTFEKFLLDDFEFVVFNDASDTAMRDKIEKTCKTLQIKCINIPQHIHNLPYLKRFPGEDFNHPSVRNSNVVQYSLNNLGFNHNGIVALFDSDLFLVRPFSIKKFMEGFGLSGMPQSRGNPDFLIDYLWIGLVFIDMYTIPDRRTLNFNCGQVEGISVDPGGHTYYYLNAHPEVPVRFLNVASWPFAVCKECAENNIRICLHNDKELRNWGFDNRQIDFIHKGPINSEFFLNGTFFHYRGGTNWDGQSANFHNNKLLLLKEYIENIVSN